MNEETIFAEALALPPAARREFVEQQSDGNRIVANRVLTLLENHEARGSLLDLPAPVAVLQEAGLDVANPKAEPASGDRIGRYRLIERIGEGGFGLVYVAEQREPVRRRVALKLLRLGMETREFIARFEVERQALALMDHPNIAGVFDAGATESGRPYLVMELVRGIPITRFCDEHRLPLRARLELFLAVCGAIQHAHQKGVIHRDLKPSNILVAREGDAPVPKVIDFGIAKTTSGPLTEKTLFTRFQAFIGTPSYTSPEQTEIGASDIDTRSDVYSLGAVLYELLAGAPPFARETLEKATFDEMRRTIREVEPSRASQQVAALAEDERALIAERRATDPRKLSELLANDLDWIVMRCLEKERSRRYETANALAMDIRRHLGNEPVVARPPSSGYRMRKFIRRHRTPVIAATAVVVSLVAGLVATGILLASERTARSRAVVAERQAEQKAQQARAAAEKSRQVAQFMKDMLAAIGPSVARGRDTTLLREVLDDTIQRLDAELRDQPDIASDLRHTLGVALREIGEYDRAMKLWREAIAARRALGDRTSVELAATLHEYGSMLARTNQAVDAEAALQEALAIRRRNLGPEHFDVGTTLAALASIVGSPRRASEREVLLREAVAIQRKHPGQNEDAFAQTLMVLGYVLLSDNRHAEAEPVLRESVNIRRQLHGDFHLSVAESIGMLARALTNMRSRSLSAVEVQLWREQLIIVQRARGLAHAKLVAALLKFTLALRPTALLQEDLRLARQVYADLRQALPADSPDLAVAQLALASVLSLDASSSAEAESLADDAEIRLRLSRERGVWPHADTSASMQTFAMQSYWTGRLRFALSIAEALRGDVKYGALLEYGPQIERTLGRIYFDLGRYAEAAALLEVSARPQGGFSNQVWRVPGRVHAIVDFAYLGDAYRELRLVSESRRVLEEGLACNFPGAPENDPAMDARATVRTELGYTALAERNFPEAESLFREALKEYDRGPAYFWDLYRPRGRAVSGLGQVLAAEGKLAEAEPLLVGAFTELEEKRATFRGDHTRTLREAARAVVWFYRETDKPEKVIEWERKLAGL